MPTTTTSCADTVSAGTTEVHFSYSANTTISSSDMQQYNPFSRLPDVMDALDAAERHQQRAVWFAPGKVQTRAPVPQVRRFQKMFRGHLFPLGRKK